MSMKTLLTLNEQIDLIIAKQEELNDLMQKSAFDFCGVRKTLQTYGNFDTFKQLSEELGVDIVTTRHSEENWCHTINYRGYDIIVLEDVNIADLKYEGALS